VFYLSVKKIGFVFYLVLPKIAAVRCFLSIL